MTETEKILMTALEGFEKERETQRKISEKEYQTLQKGYDILATEYERLSEENKVIAENQGLLDSKLDTLIELLNKKKR